MNNFLDKLEQFIEKNKILSILIVAVLAFSPAAYLAFSNEDDSGNGDGWGDSWSDTPEPVCYTNMVTNTVQSGCAVETWTDWQNVGEPQESVDSCYYNIRQERIGTGAITVFTETYDANSCTPNYSASSYKKVCQVSEARIVSYKKPECGGTDDGFNDPEVIDELETVITEGEEIEGTRTSFSDPNAALADALFISLDADPKLVRQGGSTTLIWEARSVRLCTLSGSNGDTWTYTVNPATTANMMRGISGEQLTQNPIEEETVFTLTCTTYDNRRVSESVTVKVVPRWEER